MKTISVRNLIEQVAKNALKAQHYLLISGFGCNFSQKTVEPKLQLSITTAFQQI